MYANPQGQLKFDGGLHASNDGPIAALYIIYIPEIDSTGNAR